MKTSRSRIASFLASAAILCLIAMLTTYSTSAQQTKGKGQATKANPRISYPGYIEGVVQSEKGPEAGVWVIAETNDLQTKMIKTVVTDDQGKFVLPDLPAVNYKVFSRGYGIVDSTPIDLKPGATNVTIKVATAKTPQEAAKVYPGDYWLSLMAPPAPSNFPIQRGVASQAEWIHRLKSGCNFCHQLGNAWTRDVQHVFAAKPDLAKTHRDAWEWRLGVGVRGTNMYALIQPMGGELALKTFADWTEAIEKGAVPPTPPRPTGIERNIVSTQWDVGDDHSFMHDQVSTDKNHPNINGGGPNYAVNAGHGQLVVLDQADNSTYAIDIPTRESKDKVPSRFPSPNRPSMVWGNEHLWSNPPYDPADPHNPMLDSKGRVWMTSKIRGNTAPAWCADGETNKYADWYPKRGGARQASYWDPKTKKFQLIETCYSTHHLQFDNDPDETVYFNELSGPTFGWIDSKIYDQTLAQTHDETKAEQAAVGWCDQVVDTNGDGKITRPWNDVRRVADLQTLYATDTGGGGAVAAGRGQGKGGKGGAAPVNNNVINGPFDPNADTMVHFNLYAIIPSPVDDSVWGVAEDFPGYLIRLQRGNNPPVSCKTQIFKVPSPGDDPRGVDVDTNGVVWTGLAATSHLASFDIRKCKNLTGKRQVDGSDCPEGWTLYQTPGPKMKGTDVPADFHYFNWVDQQNIIGLGKNTPFVTGSNSDSLIGLNTQTQQWTYFRIPYPLGFYARGMDGRIDDANAGWKGRALYSNYGTHFVWHIEGGKGTKGKIVKFQIRPNPLAR